jgi:hypothetical protein
LIPALRAAVRMEFQEDCIPEEMPVGHRDAVVHVDEL